VKANRFNCHFSPLIFAAVCSAVGILDSDQQQWIYPALAPYDYNGC